MGLLSDYLDLEQVGSVLRALSHQRRLEVIFCLLDGEQSVCALSEKLDINQPALSKRLASLLQSGLINRRREGRKNYYSIADANIESLLIIAEAIADKDKTKDLPEETSTTAVTRLAH